MLRGVQEYIRKRAVAQRQPAATTRLSGEQVGEFRASGFLSIPRITTDDEVAWMRDVYDRLFEQKPGWREGDFFDFAGEDNDREAPKLPQLLNPSRYEPELANTIFRANAYAMARQLLGSSAKLIFEHAMLKPARTGGETAWHQDEAFYARYTNYRAVTVWMPLQAVDERNGCMQFIPGSQNGPVRPHRHLNDDPRIHGLEAVDVDCSQVIACPLPAGGATFHGDRTLHHAGANRSDQPRRAYALVFGARSKAFVLREDFPWNRQAQTAREMRAKDARGPIQNGMVAVKNAAKAILRG